MKLDVDKIFVEELKKIVDNRKEKSLALLEHLLTEWPDQKINTTPDDQIKIYFSNFLRQVRKDLYSVQDYKRKERQENSGGENG